MLSEAMKTLVDLGSVGDSIGDSLAKTIAIVGTVAIVGVALFFFLVDSTVEDAITGALGQAFADVGLGGLSLAWTIFWAVAGLIGILLFVGWAYSKLRDSF
jgi:hypothetical protein